MFYLVETNTEINGAKSQAIYAHSDIDSALVAFHQSVAYAMSNENVLVMGRCILNDAMMPMRTENWSRPVEPVEPEQNEE